MEGEVSKKKKEGEEGGGGVCVECVCGEKE